MNTGEPARQGSEASPWLESEEFHRTGARIYPQAEPGGDMAGPPVVKRRPYMAHVRYRPAHPCPGAPGWLAGAGTAHTVWLASEQPATAEGSPTGGLLGVWETALDPCAAIGWHQHADGTELYLLISGMLTLSCGPDVLDAHEHLLHPGDQHRLPVGWGHAALAGPDGARLIVIELAAGLDSGEPSPA